MHSAYYPLKMQHFDCTTSPSATQDEIKFTVKDSFLSHSTHAHVSKLTEGRLMCLCAGWNQQKSSCYNRFMLKLFMTILQWRKTYLNDHVHCWLKHNRVKNMHVNALSVKKMQTLNEQFTQNMKILSSFTYPQIFPNLYDFLSSAEQT